MSNRWSQLLFVMGAVAVAPACSGGDSTNAKTTAAQTKAVSAVRPSQEALQAELSTLLNRDVDGLGKHALPNGGGFALHSGDRFHSAAVVRRNADGTLTTECFDDAHSAAEFMAGEQMIQGEVQ
jgi:hypothetical protein